MSAEVKTEHDVKKISVVITSAQEVVYSGDADFLIVPGREGVLGIGPHHTKLISLLKKGHIIIKNGSKERKIEVTEGMLQINRSGVDILISA
jgi:F-type H+-transporting ATPase subunit epsilon